MYKIDFSKPIHIHFIGIGGSNSSWCALDFLSYIPNAIGSYTHDLYEAEAAQVEDRMQDVQQLMYQLGDEASDPISTIKAASNAVSTLLTQSSVQDVTDADVPGLRVTRDQGRLFFGAQALPPLGTHALHPGETAEIPELGLRITVGEPEPFREIHSAFTTFCFKSAIIHDKLSVTPRRPGDRIRLAGRGCTKRVSDLFAERGLTQSARDLSAGARRAPLVAL